MITLVTGIFLKYKFLELIFNFHPPKPLILLYFHPVKNSTQKNILKKYSQIFGNIKKINSSLQCKSKFKTTNMLRIQLHIETVCFSSPKTNYDKSGACYAAS